MPRRRRPARKSRAPARKIVRQEIKKQLVKSAEPKNHYTSLASVGITFTGSITGLSNPAQGDTVQQRDGDRLQAKMLTVRGRIMSASTVAGMNAVRMIIFKWKPDSVERTPNMDDILQNAYAGAAWTPYGPVVVGEEARHITILSDRTFKVSYYGNVQENFLIKKKLTHKQYFNDTNTTGSNQIYLMLVSDDGVTAYPSATFVSNFEFVDL